MLPDVLRQKPYFHHCHSCNARLPRVLLPAPLFCLRPLANNCQLQSHPYHPNFLAMPLFHRFAGIDLFLMGPPVASQINQLSMHPKSANLSPYPCKTRAATASPPGHKINSLVRKIGHGNVAYKKAASSLETGLAFQLDWLRFWRVGSATWKTGDLVVVGARIFPFLWTANVNRVVTVARDRRRVAVGWGTTDRHVLAGEEVLQVSYQTNGDVVFTLRSFSRPQATVAWLLYPLVLALQHAFARDVGRQLERIASGAE